MEVEEMQDISTMAVKNNGIGQLGENCQKVMRMISNSQYQGEEIVNLIVFLSAMASQFNIDLEEGILNKIEELNRK